jgi:hypothetical protein
VHLRSFNSPSSGNIYLFLIFFFRSSMLTARSLPFSLNRA